MVDSERTLIFPLALRQLVFFFISHIPYIGMARIAEVRGSKAEKESDRAAVPALVVNEGFLVYLAVRHPNFSSIE